MTGAGDDDEDGYYAVIFSSQTFGPNPEYDAMAERMVELAAAQPGFLGIDSARGSDGFGITVSYWENEASIHAWRQNAEHQEAQRRGKEEWYQDYDLRIARVCREYRKRG
ncbi:MAG: antibiotic biosynthesis monooxygenase [Verrucomicrobiota bacterium]